MVALENFLRFEEKLERTRWSSRQADSTNVNARRVYFDTAAKAVKDYSGGRVNLDPSTPQPTIDEWYVMMSGVEDSSAGKHFSDNKRAIVNDVLDEQLAPLVLEMYHEPTPTRRTVRNGKIEVISKYNGIRRMNHAYDHDEKLPTSDGDVKVTHGDLLDVATPYVEEGVQERLTHPHADHPENQYISDEDRRIILSGLLGILAVSEGSTRMTTKLMEVEYKAGYEAKLPDDANKARFVRDSLARWNPDEKQSRAYLRQALGITLN